MVQRHPSQKRSRTTPSPQKPASKRAKRDESSERDETLDNHHDAEHNEQANYNASRSTTPDQVSQKMSHLTVVPPSLPNNDSEERYNAIGEVNIVYQHPLFIKTERDIPGLIQKFDAVYKRCVAAGYRNQDVTGLVEQLFGYLDPKREYPKVSPAAFVGPTGAGKSMTINCVLDMENVAIASDDSKRGTSVTHEYSTKRSEQKLPFQLRAHYHTDDFIRHTIQKHCDHIYTFRVLESVDEIDGEDEDDHDDRALQNGHDSAKEKYNTAIEYFRIILPNLKPFETLAAAEEYFDRHFEEGTEVKELVRELSGHVLDFKHSRSLDQDVETVEVLNTRDVQRQYEQVSKPSWTSRGKPHPYPIEDKIGVHFSNSIVNLGPPIADTPGFNDNSTIVGSLIRYLHRADWILILVPYSRGEEGLVKLLQLCLKLGKRKICVVPNKIDLKVTLTDDDIQSLDDDLRKKLDHAERERRAFIAGKIKLDESYAMLRATEKKTTEQHQEQSDIGCRREDLCTLIEQNESRIRHVTIANLSRRLEAEWKGKIREVWRSKDAPDLKVFPVSAAEYAKHMRNEVAKLSKEATGIPALQRFLYNIPAEGKFVTLHRIATEDLPTKLDAIIGALTTTFLERKTEVHNVIAQSLRGCSVVVENLKQELATNFEEQVFKCLTSNEQSCRQASTRLIHRWSAYHPRTFKAFAGRQGNWKVKNEVISWNLAIHNIFADKMKVGQAFLEFVDATAEVHLDAQKDIKDCFDQLEEELRKCSAYLSASKTESGQKFFDELHNQRDNLTKHVIMLIKSLHRQLGDLCSRVRVVTEEYNYAQPAMQAAYQVAFAIDTKDFKPVKGKRQRGRKTPSQQAHAERVRIIQNRLSGSTHPSEYPDAVGPDPDLGVSVFETMMNKVKEDFQELVKQTTTKISNKVDKTTKAVLRSFNGRFVERQDQTGAAAKHPEAVGMLLEAANEAMKTVEGLKE